MQNFFLHIIKVLKFTAICVFRIIIFSVSLDGFLAFLFVGRLGQKGGEMPRFVKNDSFPARITFVPAPIGSGHQKKRGNVNE